MKISLVQPTLLLFIITSIIGCADHEIKKEETEQYDFAFGSFYGECMGEQCVEFFIVREGKLFENTSDQYPNQQEEYTFNALVELDQQNYELVKNIRDGIPADLFDQRQTVIGCPDCSDGGGIYLKVTRNGEARHWYIDAQRTEPYLENFILDLKEKIRLLNP
jgi:hypothetical protein